MDKFTEIQRLADLFDRDDCKVRGTLPGDIILGQIVGVSPHGHKMKKITLRKGPVTYICLVSDEECATGLLYAKKEIAQRKDWHNRYDAWELYGSSDPLALQARLLKSRLRTSDERKEFELFYGEKKSLGVIA